MFDGVSARPRTVRLRIDALGLHATIGEQQLQVSVEDVWLRERSEVEALQLEVPQYPEGVLLIEDAEAADVLDRLGYAMHTRPASVGPSNRRVAALLASLVLVIVLFLTWGLERVVDACVRLVPENVEAELGESVYRTLVDEQRIVQTNDMQWVLTRASALVQSFGARGTDTIAMTVIDDSTVVNAFTLPGGHIVLYSGMLARLDSEDELFGLLAHELGHVHLRHGIRHVARQDLLSFVFTTLFGEAKDVSTLLVDHGAELVDLAYGRREEREADAFALQALASVGLDPRGLPSLFEKLQGLETAGVPEILSTHPTTAKRIEELERQIAALHSTTPRRAPVFSEREWKTWTQR